MDSVQTLAALKMTALDGGAEAGIVWATCPAPLYGAVNGYIQIPDGHPWSGLDYDEIHEVSPGLSVHGGLTFAEGGWVGFDTLHLGDVWPGGPHYCRDRACDCIRWTPSMVAEEARRLARLAAEVSA